ncbi:MAG TPA: AMP-binding protein [Cyclobacteriaceae bacterium]|nr:AMP-binding protein [Cyclobacteriaceae bacterium]
MNTASVTLLEKFYEWEKRIPDQTFLRQPVNGQWIEYSFRKTGDEIRRVAAYLKSLGLPRGSKIALLSKNCAHWIMADVAIWMAGHVSVPLYPTLTAPSIKQILDHSESSVIFIGKLDDYPAQKQGIGDNLKIISFPLYGIEDGKHWDHILQEHQPLTGEIIRNKDDLATISYTSGTTGIPKGVMFTFAAVGNAALIAFQTIDREIGLPKHPKLFSYLPLSHIAERMIVEAGGIYYGAHISFVESLDVFGKNLADTQPDIFFGVPRIWARFHEKLLEKIPQKKLSILLAIPIVNDILRRTIKKNMGLLRALNVSGAAPIAIPLLHWFRSLGIIIHEVYGMTENSGVSHVNLTDEKIGTVGRPWPGVEIQLSEAGEILTRHSGMMSGYYKAPEMTAEIFTTDGFIKTGDKGSVDADGFMTITGRIKDLFKTDKGKYVAPGPIETKLLANADIEQVCVVGMGIPQPIALMVLSSSGKSKSREAIIESLSHSLTEVNEKLESYEKLETAVVMRNTWTVENGLMTPTLKVKRNEVEKIHLPRYSKWYHEKGLVVWE